MGFKYSVNEKFFETWTSHMAYTLGFIYADGNIHKSSRGHYLVITNTEEVLIRNIKRWLNAAHPIVLQPPTSPQRKMRFNLRIGNKKIYHSLLAHKLYPNKSLTARMPEIPKEFIGDFVRGYFDGDGCVNLYRSKGTLGQLIIRKLSIIFTSGSEKFLIDLLIALRSEILSLRQTKIYKSQRAYQLRFATKDTIALFGFIYKTNQRELLLVRKFNVFEKYFSLRPTMVDKTAENILQFLGTGHVVK